MGAACATIGRSDPIQNSNLLTEADAWRAAHPDAVLLVYDAWQEFTLMLDHPEFFGFKDLTSDCYWYTGQIDINFSADFCSHVASWRSHCTLKLAVLRTIRRSGCAEPRSDQSDEAQHDVRNSQSSDRPLNLGRIVRRAETPTWLTTADRARAVRPAAILTVRRPELPSTFAHGHRCVRRCQSAH